MRDDRVWESKGMRETTFSTGTMHDLKRSMLSSSNFARDIVVAKSRPSKRESISMEAYTTRSAQELLGMRFTYPNSTPSPKPNQKPKLT